LLCDRFRHFPDLKKRYIKSMSDVTQSSQERASPQPRFIGSEIYRHSSYGAWPPLRVPRVSTVMDLTRALGWLPPAQFVTSPRAKAAALTSYHTPAYLAALQAAEAAQEVSEDIRARHALGTPSNPVFREMFRRPATSAGASLLAGELLKHGGVVYSPAGGTHHGMPDRANGFCYLNDPVLAIQSLRRNGAARVAYVDIDAHHPDGVEHAFADDPDTLQISVHEQNRWPRTGALTDKGVGQVYNLPVRAGLNDEEMALIRDDLILPLLSDFRPDAVVLQCGADAVTEDPQSRLTLSNNAHWAIVAALAPLTSRYLVLGGGGYNPWSVGRLWTGVWATLNGYDIPDDLPAAAQRVLGALSWEGPLRKHDPQDHWITQLRDAPRGGAIRSDLRADVHSLATRHAAEV
jgi:acetoin utilization protein AcuC